MAAGWNDPGRTEALKKEASGQLDAGVRQFALDVDMMSPRERQKLRMHINRWMRINRWYGAVHYDPIADTMTVAVLERREEPPNPAAKDGPRS